jgi:ferredoxin-thioredoxin reductase catalytic subunit/rhodanese-related sulfurtransferase
MNSEEFQAEFELTKKFTDNVCEKFGFVYNPQADINESIQQGLTRNKMIYGKRYCPCFMVIGETKEEQKAADNRLCPCTPALETEIPKDGNCHCSIFCTPEYAKSISKEEEIEEVTATHSRGLTKEECELLLTKDEVDAEELESLLEAREIGFVNFTLVDTREWMEWLGNRIKGTDFLVPTTSFYNSISQIDDKKDIPVVVYCFSGSRSAYCQQVMKDMGYKSVTNLRRGIMTYRGEIINGEE